MVSLVPQEFYPYWPSTGLGRIRRRTGAMVLRPQLASGEMKSPGGMRRELATPQLVHNSTLRPDQDMGTIKSG
jgi:hypothetical protein